MGEETYSADGVEWAQPSLSAGADPPLAFVLRSLLWVWKLATQELSVVAQARGLAGSTNALWDFSVARSEAAHHATEWDGSIAFAAQLGQSWVDFSSSSCGSFCHC